MDAASWHLLVVGDGDINHFRNVAHTAGVEGRVHWVGHCSSVAAYYAAADVFVFPTAYETFSLVAHEACASGLPVLATRVSGIEDPVEPGVNGWFINGVEDLAERLRALEADPELLRRMRSAAAESAGRFTPRAMVGAYEQTYRASADRVRRRQRRPRT
jgi:UDP-glucose:(heptosyl)LPS alpha-1,3-glucosyltransferase